MDTYASVSLGSVALFRKAEAPRSTLRYVCIWENDLKSSMRVSGPCSPCTDLGRNPKFPAKQDVPQLSAHDFARLLSLARGQAIADTTDGSRLA